MKKIALVTLAGLLLSANAHAKKFPDVTADGLERVKDSKMQAVYLAPDANFSGYDKILLQPATVAFKKNWQRDLERNERRIIPEQDINNIRQRLAADLGETFSQALTEGGYTLVNEPGADVLEITPSIMDLYINAPDIPSAGRRDSYTESAGYMTLNLSLADSETGQLLAQAMDRKEDPHRGFMMWSNSVTNKAAADRILKRWAKTLTEGLNEVRQSGSPQG